MAKEYITEIQITHTIAGFWNVIFFCYSLDAMGHKCFKTELDRYVNVSLIKVLAEGFLPSCASTFRMDYKITKCGPSASDT